MYMRPKSKDDSACCVGFNNIYKSELKKSVDTSVSKTILWTIVFLTIAMFIVGIFRIKDGDEWTTAFQAISSPSTTLLGIIFILLVCEEWTQGTALITYTLIPNRTKVVMAKLVVLCTYFIVTIMVLYVLTAGAASITVAKDSYTINWSQSFVSVISLCRPLLVNLLLAFAFALALKETTFALGLYFFIPPTTVVLSNYAITGKVMKWISLSHSSSLFIAGSTKVGTSQYISSIVFWIVLPLLYGIYSNKRCDI